VEEILYEGFAPGGVGIVVRTLTDNRNRTAPNMRHIFSAFGGNLGETGTVSNFAFDYKGVIIFDNIDDVLALESAILETDADDYHIEARIATVYVDRTKLIDVKKNLENAGFTVDKASLEFIPKNYVEVTDFDNALKIYKMLEEFGEDEDTEVVWNNADISDALWAEVETFVESKKFRT
jgi:transcriptional/translational regulatory protein YebC/TACO1